MGDDRKTEQSINNLLYKNKTSNVPLMGFKAQEMFNVHSANAKPKRTAMDDPKMETFLRPKKPKTQSDEGIFVTSFHLPSIWDLQSDRAKKAVAQMGKYTTPTEFQRQRDESPKDKPRFVRRFKIPGNLAVKTQLARFQESIHSYDPAQDIRAQASTYRHRALRCSPWHIAMGGGGGGIGGGGGAGHRPLSANVGGRRTCNYSGFGYVQGHPGDGFTSNAPTYSMARQLGHDFVPMRSTLYRSSRSLYEGNLSRSSSLPTLKGGAQRPKQTYAEMHAQRLCAQLPPISPWY